MANNTNLIACCLAAAVRQAALAFIIYDFDEVLALDVWYVDNWSSWLDLKILWLTLVKVVKRSGISAAGHATMPEFRGRDVRL